MNALVVSFGWETAVDRDVVDRHHAIAGCSARMHLDSVSRSFPNKPRPGTARSRSKSRQT